MLLHGTRQPFWYRGVQMDDYKNVDFEIETSWRKPKTASAERAPVLYIFTQGFNLATCLWNCHSILGIASWEQHHIRGSKKPFTHTKQNTAKVSENESTNALKTFTASCQSTWCWEGHNFFYQDSGVRWTELIWPGLRREIGRNEHALWLISFSVAGFGWCRKEYFSGTWVQLKDLYLINTI